MTVGSEKLTLSNTEKEKKKPKFLLVLWFIMVMRPCARSPNHFEYS